MDERKTNIEDENNANTLAPESDDPAQPYFGAEQIRGERYYKCIDGVRRKNRIIGKCRCNAHVGALTPDLLKEHECLKKKCPFLIRFEESPFWEEREKQKQLSRLLRMQKREAEQRFKDALSAAEAYLKDVPNIKLQRAEPFKNGIKIWVHTPSAQNIKNIHAELKNTLKIPVWLTRIELSYRDSIKMLGDKFTDESKKEEKNRQMNAIISHSRDNQPDVIISEQCGCYGCLSVFPSEDITEYVKGEVFSTAKCPVCGKATVLPQHPDYELSKTLLNNVHRHFYKPRPPKKNMYIGNAKTKKLHTSSCVYAMSKNQIEFTAPEKAITAGYCPCKFCMKDFESNIQ